MNLENKPQSRNSEILIQEIVDELMIYDLKINKAYLLNHTSSVIWNLCDGERSVSKIAELAGQKLKAKISEDFVWLAIEEFKKDNLLADNKIGNPLFSELSRREAIRKVGLVSIAALPFVTSIVVPNAAEGASCLADAAPCVSPQQCCNQCCFFNSSLGDICVTPVGSCPVPR